ncbi:hypothetical protein [Halorubrum pallidum]|uniref:Uncharacterized protein n=1 Tax=Halorubrum pallidum TaxID=1526114 RepID=A0ABD5T629_9EURY
MVGWLIDYWHQLPSAFIWPFLATLAASIAILVIKITFKIFPDMGILANKKIGTSSAIHAQQLNSLVDLWKNSDSTIISNCHISLEYDKKRNQDYPFPVDSGIVEDTTKMYIDLIKNHLFLEDECQTVIDSNRSWRQKRQEFIDDFDLRDYETGNRPTAHKSMKEGPIANVVFDLVTLNRNLRNSSIDPNSILKKEENDYTQFIADLESYGCGHYYIGFESPENNAVRNAYSILLEDAVQNNLGDKRIVSAEQDLQKARSANETIKETIDDIGDQDFSENCPYNTPSKKLWKWMKDTYEANRVKLDND